MSSRLLFAAIILLSLVSVSHAAPTTTFYVSDDIDTQSIYKITSTGIITPVAQNLPEPGHMAIDSSGNLYVGCDGDGTIREISPTGQVSLFASGFSEPGGLAFDSTGDFFIANTNADTVVEITPGGSLSNFVSNLFAEDLVIDSSNNIFVSSIAGYDTSNIYKITPDKQLSTYASDIPFDGGMTFGPGGNLFCANYSGVDIVEVSTAGGYTTFATGSTLNGPTDVAFDSSGNLFATDYPATLQSDAITAVSPAAQIDTFLTVQQAEFFPNDIFSVVPEPSSLPIFFTCLAALTFGRRCKMMLPAARR